VTKGVLLLILNCSGRNHFISSSFKLSLMTTNLPWSLPFLARCPPSLDLLPLLICYIQQHTNHKRFEFAKCPKYVKKCRLVNYIQIPSFLVALVLSISGMCFMRIFRFRRTFSRQRYLPINWLFPILLTPPHLVQHQHPNAALLLSINSFDCPTTTWDNSRHDLVNSSSPGRKIRVKIVPQNHSLFTLSPIAQWRDKSFILILLKVWRSIGWQPV